MDSEYLHKLKEQVATHGDMSANDKGIILSLIAVIERLGAELERLAEVVCDEDAASIATALAAAASPTGKILPMPKLPNPDGTYWHGGGSSPFRSPAAAREHLNKMKAEADAVRDECFAVVENNKKVYAALHTVMTAAGLSTLERHVVGKVRTKTERRAAGWVTSLATQIPQGNPVAVFDAAYERSMKYIAEWGRKLEEQNAQKLREQDASQKKAKLEQTIGVMASKYGVDLPADAYSVMKAMLSKNKYLKLAHWLAKNRGNWTDGCDYARTGLDGFTVETPDDHAIVKELHGLCSDWDGDGRVFRDCVWNYERLFGIAAAEVEDLFDDYTAMREMVDD